MEIAEFLVSRGADVNSKNNDDKSPLEGAVMLGDIETIKFLVSKGANVNAGDSIRTAVALGNLEKIKTLVSLGANVNGKNENGETLLDLAKRLQTFHKNTAIVQYLSSLPAVSAESNPFSVTAGMILYEGMANHIKVLGSSGGQLTLTSEALIFKPHQLNFQTDSLTIPLEQCANVATYNALFLIPNGMKIEMNNGLIEKFVVYGRNTWIEKIQQAIASKTTRQPVGQNQSAPAMNAPAIAPTGILATLTTKSVTLAQAKRKSKILWLMCLPCLVLTFVAAMKTIPNFARALDWQCTGDGGGMVLIIPPVLALLVFFFWAIVESGGQFSACPKCEKLDADEIVREETQAKKKKTESRTKETGRIRHSGNRPDTVITSTVEVPVTEHTIKRYHQCKFCQHHWEDVTTRTTDGWDS